MSRLPAPTAEEATGKTAEVFGNIKNVMGRVPNAYLAIGSHAPDILAQTLQLNVALARSSLNAREREAINLIVSEESGCDYCLAAHTPLARKAGYSEAQTLQLRQGYFEENTKIDALVKFVQILVTTRGTVAPGYVNAFRSAGFTDQQVVETIGVVTAILFTNMFNRVNDTDVDFPAVNAL
ncbi:alkylhydroperoxidase [Chimaeribacter californicus]|uniref:Alkylhydroperoxidase n=1 Tax=Chimaeribacter californicus TaxID=2060067 RepID=A0A2N5E868_9GAMM|nr:carboxymuconolactone decarboxylase family protein [Chimaeribacter californicus]PLR37859.1 alkylhydroperoxidase [Chimaeribacter californicus]